MPLSLLPRAIMIMDKFINNNHVRKIMNSLSKKYKEYLFTSVVSKASKMGVHWTDTGVVVPTIYNLYQTLQKYFKLY